MLGCWEHPYHVIVLRLVDALVIEEVCQVLPQEVHPLLHNGPRALIALLCRRFMSSRGA